MLACAVGVEPSSPRLQRPAAATVLTTAARGVLLSGAAAAEPPRRWTVFVGRHVGVVSTPGIDAARDVISGADAGYVALQITRMETAVQNDPGLAIGTAKELIETCCRTILAERGITIPRSPDLPHLIKLRSRELELTPSIFPTRRRLQIRSGVCSATSRRSRRASRNSATSTEPVHGRQASARGLGSRHAKLAVGAASTLAVFLVETHRSRLGARAGTKPRAGR